VRRAGAAAAGSSTISATAIFSHAGVASPLGTAEITALARSNAEAVDPEERTASRPYTDTAMSRPYTETSIRRVA